MSNLFGNNIVGFLMRQLIEAVYDKSVFGIRLHTNLTVHRKEEGKKLGNKNFGCSLPMKKYSNFFLPLCLDSKISNKTYENKINIG